MTTIGYATLQIIPSLDGVSKSIERQLGGLRGVGRAVGKSLGDDLAEGVDQASAKVEASAAKVTSALKKVEDQTGKVRVAEAQLQTLRDRGITDAGRLAAAEERVAAAKRNLVQAEGAHTTSSRAATAAQESLNRAQNEGERGARRLSTSFSDMSRNAGKGSGSLLTLATAAASVGAKGVLGFSLFLGVASGVSSMLAGPMVAALAAVGAAMGVAAAAATGILGPALLSLGLGFKGMQAAAKAYASSDGGASQAKAVATASKQVEQAEKGVERAKRDSRDAERDLTRARKDALEQIQDMNLALKGAALSEKDAQLSLLEARRDLQNLGKDGQSFDMIDRERAILRVQEAEQRLAETQESNGDLADKAAESNRVGVEGSDEVVAAKQRQADANQAVIDSQQQLADAMRAVADAQSQGQSGVDPFDLMIGQRMAPALDAVKSLKQTVTDSLTTALVPAFNTFGGLVDGMKPKLAGLSGLFGTIGSDVMKSLSGPEATQGFNNMLDGSTKFFSAFKGESGLGGLATGLASFAGTAATTFAGVGVRINGVLQGIGDWLRNITPEQMTAAFDKLRQVFQSIRDVVGPIFSALREFGGIAAPALAPGFKAIGDAIKAATPGVMAMARELMPALGQVMQNLAPILPSLVDSFRPWATVIAVIAPHLATVVSHLGPLAPLILGVVIAAKAIGGAMVVWNIAMAAASIAQGLFVAATGGSTVALGTNAIALKAHRVGMVAGAAATGIVTGATWLFNAALNANPIGLIVLALAGLVAGLVYAYKNSETFRNIVQAAWSGIKTAVSAVWDWISTTLWPGIKAVFQGIGDVAMWLWNNALKPAWAGIKAGLEVAWAAIKVIFDVWKTEWQLIGDGAMWLWNNAIKPAWEGIQTAFGVAWDFVSGIFGKFKTGWDTLKTGVVGAADAIKSGVTNAFRGLVDIIKAPLKMLGTFLEAIPTEVFGISIPGVETLNNWGKSLKGLSGGGYTGAMAADEIAGVVHGGEHVIKATSRTRIENAYPGLLDFMNNNGKLPMPGYADGGPVDRAKTFAVSMDPATYQMGGFSTSAIDCSGFVSAVVNVATGRGPFESRMSTVTEGSWLQSLGFKSGSGGPGDLRVGWWDKGGGANGHTAGTFPDGTNFESNGSQGVVIGGKTGANDGQFSQHAYLPGQPVGNPADIGNPNGSPADSTSAPTTGGASGLFSDASVAAMPSAGGGSGGGGGVPSSFSGLASMPFDSLGSGVGKTSSGSDLGLFGKGVGSAVGGQVDSALGVLGVNGSPGWLQAASKLVGGLKVSDSNGSTIFDGSNPLGGFGQGSGTSAAPLSATSTSSGAPPPDNAGSAHGTRAGQQPGPVYNIHARDTEDAFVRAQRVEREKAAAKLSRF